MQSVEKFRASGIIDFTRVRSGTYKCVVLKLVAKAGNQSLRQVGDGTGIGMGCREHCDHTSHNIGNSTLDI